MVDRYIDRVWLNADDSPSTGSVVAYDGPDNWASGERSQFLEIADCHNKVRLHRSKLDTVADFAAKVRRLAEAAGRFADHLGVLEGSVIDEIAAERRRQIEVEGWTLEHDDRHAEGQLALAAAVYAMSAGGRDAAWWHWPWSARWLKPTTPRRDLIKAAALIVAEIERLDRREETCRAHARADANRDRLNGRKSVYEAAEKRAKGKEG